MIFWVVDIGVIIVVDQDVRKAAENGGISGCVSECAGRIRDTCTQICSPVSAALDARTKRIKQENLAREARIAKRKEEKELLASGFRTLAQIVKEDPVAFVERPNVKAFLARTGARSTEEVIECGLAKEFFDTFDTFGIPRERAQEHLGLEKADGTKESTALGAPASAIPGTTVYGTPMR